MPNSKKHNPLLGYIIGLLAQLGIIITAALSQKLSSVPSYQKLYFIQFQSCVWTYIISKKLGLEYVFNQREKLLWTLARAGLGVFAFGIYIIAIVLLPLSEGTVVNMLLPVTAGIFSAFLLGERYDFSMLLITVCSFTGVVLIAKPGFLFPGIEIDSSYEHRMLGIFLMGFSATVGGLNQIVMKKASALVDPIVLSSYFGLLSGMLFGLLSIMSGIKNLTSQEIVYIILSGLMWSFAQCAMILQYKFGQAGRLSVLYYTQVFFAFFYDVVIVGLTPDFYSILGGVSISLCIFILMWKVYREENKKIQEQKFQEKDELLAQK